MNPDIKIVQPNGVLDGSEANQLRAEIDQIVQSGATCVLVDMKDITFIDSSGLGALVQSFKSARAAGAKFCVCSVSDQARMLFEITGMDQFFEIFPTQRDFHKAVAEIA